MPARQPLNLIERLPKVRGRLVADAPLAANTWFRVGGPAEVLFRPADMADLTDFLAAKPADVPVTVIGVASNLLVRDGGVPGVVIRLGRPFADVAVKGDQVYAGAGALDANVAESCAQAGLGGLEFLSGVPGTIGGALRMNAGAYGAEIRDVLSGAAVIDGSGHHLVVTPDELDLGYRHCGAPADWVFLHATLKGVPEDPAVVAARIADIQAQRQATQPIRSRTGGSTFANPPGHKAWALIDQAGCRGLVRGAAMVSQLHTNFLINRGEATAADLEGLGEEVRRRVFETSGITLDWEIRRIGRPLPGIEGVAP
ncbi:MAG TPA: UDP-N-acetylmuramate dehydrogenase [Aliidongia sp.]|uniref:UDP-N-acetylmuramate dehydrogenase n=1 Tax=Aliidongia sp. TaxID=1914230 RepID=UPI002DDD7EFE|nr:UDP-N-acetylmuramate dehydrogenase [Aliidongia sp.]HEV2676702.1 UDP-N-acetylmuramate dehydrogenase [Aliidongia sp.]